MRRMIPGICLQILCAVTSIYTLYLLVILYLHRFAVLDFLHACPELNLSHMLGRKLELIKSGLWYDEGSTNKR